MTQKTGIKKIPTFLVLAALGVGAFMMAPKLKTIFDNDPDAIVMTVEFSPARRTGKPLRPGGNLTDRVTIQWSTTTDRGGPDKVTRSPWASTTHAKKGQVIELYAEQFVGATLSCRIVYHGETIATDQSSGPSFVRCRKGLP
jgi:hypothetical protein